MTARWRPPVHPRRTDTDPKTVAMQPSRAEGPRNEDEEVVENAGRTGMQDKGEAEAYVVGGGARGLD